MRGIKKLLANPFVLGAQGFLAGAALFTATHAPPAEANPPQQAAALATEKPQI